MGKGGVWACERERDREGEKEKGKGITWDPRTSVVSRLSCGSGRRTGAY